MARGGTGPENGMPPGVRPLTVGDPVIIGRHLLLGRLGAGGMGVVYLAEHPRGGMVAIKTPHPVHLDDPTLRARFAEEVEFSRRVVPFCTAAVIEDGTDRERPYLVSEYVPGPSLAQVVTAWGPLTPDLAYGVALGVAAALAAVHEAGLVHRDLKPANVLLSPAGPRVIDFGIARDVDGLAAHTEAGQVMGSPGWVAPERLTGGRALPASDVFSWGCLVAYAATGHHPFGAGEPDVLTRRILVEPPGISTVPALLRPIVEAALEKEPSRRPSAADLLGALLAAGGVGDPRDLREAVDWVLAETWTPFPHPPQDDDLPQAVPGGPAPLFPARHDPRPRPALPGRPALPARPEVRPMTGRGGPRTPEETVPPVRRPRRAAPRHGVHLSQAGFAVLATVSMAALAVVAAGNGGAGADGGPRRFEPVPLVIPADDPGTSTVSGVPRPAGRGVRPARPSTPSEVTVTATRTLPAPEESGRSGGSDQDGRWGPEERPGGRGDGDGDGDGSGAPEEPRPCGAGGARPAPGGECPSPTGGAKPSFTRIPQTGDGESPSPGPSGSATPTATATASPTSGPSVQIGG
ncbi:protein kinase [Planomonospora corallina]|uniref:Protein kinase n=1 Tax=Planomonospora corallina TaxID=1806052 RepID=A0ABV8I3X8_9ACTN